MCTRSDLWPDSIDVVRWSTNFEKTSVPTDLLPDDTVSAAIAAISNALNTVNVCVWIDYTPTTDIPIYICSEALDRNIGAISSIKLLRIMATYCHVSAAMKTRIGSVPLMTWDQAVTLLTKEFGSVDSVTEPIGVIPVTRYFHPNPFLTRENIENFEMSVIDQRKRTLESMYRDKTKRVHLNVATIDDVRMHLNNDVKMLRYFFPEESFPPERSVIASIPAIVCSPASFEEVHRLRFIILRTLHVEVRRLETLGNSPSTRLHAVSLIEAFEAVNLGKDYPVARIIDKSVDQGTPRYRIFKADTILESTSKQYMMKTLQRNLLRSTDSVQLAVFGIRSWSPTPTGCWCVTLTLTVGGGVRIDVHLSNGDSPLIETKNEMTGILKNVIHPLLSLLGLSTTMESLDVDLNATSSDQRIVSATVTTLIRSAGSAPSANVLAVALKSPGLETFVDNVDTVANTVVFHYRKTSNMDEIVPAQQTIHLNSATPPHILIGIVHDRHGLERVAAQHLVDEEFAKREYYALNPPTFIIAKPSLNVGIHVTIKGVTDIAVIARVTAIVVHASGLDSSLEILQDEIPQDDYDEESEIDDVLAAAIRDDPVSGAAVVEEIPGRYVISELHKADANLFDTGSKHKRYSRICGHVNLRQPIRVSPHELGRIEKDFPGSLSGSVSSGSSPAAVANNRYVCPKVWCPKSRVAMTMEQYESHGKRCPVPEIQEEAMVFDDPNYWNGRERHPGFLDPKFHPDGLCMPCCFLKPGRKQGRCQPESVKNVKAEKETTNARYIYGDNTSLPDGRYGFLPQSLHRIVNSGSACARNMGTHLTNRVSCILRKGVASNKRSIFESIAMILKLDRSDLMAIIREKLDVETFLALHRGELARSFAPASLTSALADPVAVESFCAWFAGLPASHVEKFRLREVLVVVKNGKFAEAAAKGLVLLRDIVLLQAAREYSLFIALQGYVDAVSKTRTHHLLLDLVNVAPPWLNPDGVYLIVMTRDGDDPAFACPLFTARFNAARVAFVIQQGDQYEALCTVSGVRGGIVEDFAFDAHRVPGVRALMVAVASACSTSTLLIMTAASILRALLLLGEIVKYQVINYKLQCVGLVTASGTYVPLSEPDGIMLNKPDVHVIYVEDALKVMKDDASPERERVVTAMFGRLAAVTGDKAFEVIRVVQHNSGSRGVLLKMGKATPLSLDAEVTARYMAHINSFVNVPAGDARVTAISAADDRDADIARVHRLFLIAAQGRIDVLQNVTGVVAPTCVLPWDVKHKYIAWSVDALLPGRFDATMCGEVADRILLGIRRKGHLKHDPNPDIVSMTLDEFGENEAKCDRTRKEVVVAMEEFPGGLQPAAASALGVTRGSRKESLVSKASMRAKSLAKSNRNKSGKSSRQKIKIEMINVPMTEALVVDIMYHANAVLHPDAPVNREALATIAAGSPPLQALLALSRFLSVPVVKYLPESGSFAPQEGHAGDGCILVTGGDVVLTRYRSRHRGSQMFGLLTSLSQMSDPNVIMVT